jgi:hypothetical protein
MFQDAAILTLAAQVIVPGEQIQFSKLQGG